MASNYLFQNGLVYQSVKHGDGGLVPITFNWDLNKGISLMNPSIFNDGGQLRCNVRCINYILHQTEYNKYPHWAGPLQYIHPENDLKLATENFIIDLDDNLNITKIRYVDMRLNSEPKWDFTGLEDARLVRWNGDLYLCGVRRDTEETGIGRMELSKVELTNTEAIEVSRVRIPAPGKNDSYCEKNWMPILNYPFSYVKWTNPTELVEFNPLNLSSTSYYPDNGRVSFNLDFRGGSHVVNYKDYYIAFGHSVRLWKPLCGEKDSIYDHHIAIWDKNFNLLKITKPFKFINAKIEFACGLCIDNSGMMIVSFAETDNVPYLLRFNPEWLLNEIL